jgi:hypothetical protein
VVYPLLVCLLIGLVSLHRQHQHQQYPTTSRGHGGQYDSSSSSPSLLPQSQGHAPQEQTSRISPHDPDPLHPMIELHPDDHVYRGPSTLPLNWSVTTGYLRPDGVLKRVYLINGGQSRLTSGIMK